jgi:multiple sugar transport system substrate-binding protein
MRQYYIPVYFIWKFAKNIEGAKQFLIDYVSNLRKAFIVSKFRDFPCFPNTVPELNKFIENDSRGHPPTKYNVLRDARDWMANIGYPDYTNAAIQEIGTTGVITTMFREAAIGETKPVDAIKAAEERCKRIFSEWKAKKLI